jgi:hypothetical protein
MSIPPFANIMEQFGVKWFIIEESRDAWVRRGKPKEVGFGTFVSHELFKRYCRGNGQLLGQRYLVRVLLKRYPFGKRFFLIEEEANAAQRDSHPDLVVHTFWPRDGTEEEQRQYGGVDTNDYYLHIRGAVIFRLLLNKPEPVSDDDDDELVVERRRGGGAERGVGLETVAKSSDLSTRNQVETVKMTTAPTAPRATGNPPNMARAIASARAVASSSKATSSTVCFPNPFFVC